MIFGGVRRAWFMGPGIAMVDDSGCGVGLCQPTHMTSSRQSRAGGSDGGADGSGDDLRDFMQKRVSSGGPVDERCPWDTVRQLAGVPHWRELVRSSTDDRRLGRD
jgi:hypothetical protein